LTIFQTYLKFGSPSILSLLFFGQYYASGGLNEAASPVLCIVTQVFIFQIIWMILNLTLDILSYLYFLINWCILEYSTNCGSSSMSQQRQALNLYLPCRRYWLLFTVRAKNPLPRSGWWWCKSELCRMIQNSIGAPQSCSKWHTLPHARILSISMNPST